MLDTLVQQNLNSANLNSMKSALMVQKKALDTAKRAEKLSPEMLQRIDESATKYESIFLSEMLNHMFKEVSFDPMNDTDSGGPQDIYKQHLVTEFADIIAEQGGIGLAKDIRAQLIELQTAK